MNAPLDIRAAWLAPIAVQAHTETALADCGQPRWPGWELLLAALVGLQLAVAAQQALGAGVDQPRPPRPGVTRIVRGGPRGGGGRDD